MRLSEHRVIKLLTLVQDSSMEQKLERNHEGQLIQLLSVNQSSCPLIVYELHNFIKFGLQS